MAPRLAPAAGASIRARPFSRHDPRSCRSSEWSGGVKAAVGIAQNPDYLIEIDAVAVVPEPKSRSLARRFVGFDDETPCRTTNGSRVGLG